MEPHARNHGRLASRPTRVAGGVAASLLAAWAASAEVATKPRPSALQDGAHDSVVLRAFVPSGLIPQGEVRLIRRGGAVVMQTVLHTGFLERAVARIRSKELASWPPERAGHEDAIRYVDAVVDAGRRIRDSAGTRGGSGGDRRRSMLIEFILSVAASVVEISEPDVERVDGHLRIVSKRPIAVLELSRSYVRGDIREIARDALGLGEKEARELLDPMLPPEPGGRAASSGEKGEKGADR